MLNEKRDGIGSLVFCEEGFPDGGKDSSKGRVSKKREEAIRLDVRAQTGKMMEIGKSTRLNSSHNA